MAVISFRPQITDADLFAELFAGLETAFAGARVPLADRDLAALAMREWKVIEAATGEVVERRALIRHAVEAVADMAPDWHPNRPN